MFLAFKNSQNGKCLPIYSVRHPPHCPRIKITYSAKKFDHFNSPGASGGGRTRTLYLMMVSRVVYPCAASTAHIGQIVAESGKIWHAKMFQHINETL